MSALPMSDLAGAADGIFAAMRGRFEQALADSRAKGYQEGLNAGRREALARVLEVLGSDGAESQPVALATSVEGFPAEEVAVELHAADSAPDERLPPIPEPPQAPPVIRPAFPPSVVGKEAQVRRLATQRPFIGWSRMAMRLGTSNATALKAVRALGLVPDYSQEGDEKYLVSAPPCVSRIGNRAEENLAPPGSISTSRCYKFWTPALDEELRRLWLETDLPALVIARNLKASSAGIVSNRASELGLGRRPCRSAGNRSVLGTYSPRPMGTFVPGSVSGPSGPVSGLQCGTLADVSQQPVPDAPATAPKPFNNAIAEPRTVPPPASIEPKQSKATIKERRRRADTEPLLRQLWADQNLSLSAIAGRMGWASAEVVTATASRWNLGLRPGLRVHAGSEPKVEVRVRAEIEAQIADNDAVPVGLRRRCGTCRAEFHPRSFDNVLCAGCVQRGRREPEVELRSIIGGSLS